LTVDLTVKPLKSVENIVISENNKNSPGKGRRVVKAAEEARRGNEKHENLPPLPIILMK
jgi:hypothetical protein